MSRLLCVAIALSILLSPTIGRAEGWASPRRNMMHHNSSPDQPEPPFQEMYHLDSAIDPIVEGDILITSQSDLFGKKLVAYRLSSGQKLWEYSTGNALPTQPAIHGGTLYFGLFGNPIVIAISLLTGKERWRVTLTGEKSGLRFSPTIIGDSLFVTIRSIHQLSLNGEWQWSTFYAVDRPLATDGTALYVRTHDMRLLKMDPMNHSTVWSAPLESTWGGAPVIINNLVYISTYRRLLAIDRQTGQRSWLHDSGLQAPSIDMVSVAGDLVFASSNDGRITALNQEGQLVWSTKVSEEVGWLAHFMVAGDRIIARANLSEHIILNALTGEIMIHQVIGQAGAIPKGIAHRRLLMSVNGQVIVVDAAIWGVGTLPPPFPAETPDPVLIVPGLLGSWPINGQWQLDPILKTYEPLLQAFRAAGYVDNQTLFTLPYDWHRDNVLTAGLLKQRLAEIRQQTGVSKVDVVAHSMGGLIARSYVVSEEYVQDIDQLVMVATPHEGAVSAYLTWEAAEIGPGLTNYLQEQLLAIESWRAGYGHERLRYVREKVETIGQLLPRFNYLERNSSLLDYSPCDLVFYPCNAFLDRLAERDDTFLTRVRPYNYIGYESDPHTLKRLRIDEDSGFGEWQHGQPLNYPADDGLMYGAGDGTVLLESAQLVGVDETLITADHLKIVGQAAPTIVERLSQRQIQVDLPVWPGYYVLIKLAAPLRLLLTDTTGRRAGYEYQSGQTYAEIPGAYYDQQDGYEFLVVPGNVPAGYVLTIDGEEGSAYQVEVTHISPTQTQEVTQRGEIVARQPDNFKVETSVGETVLIPTTPQPGPSPSPSPCLPSPTPNLVFKPASSVTLSR